MRENLSRVGSSRKGHRKRKGGPAGFMLITEPSARLGAGSYNPEIMT